MIRLRKSEERGHANHGWLDTYHTFSFSSFYDPKFVEYHNLRVINEDRVEPDNGFGKHPHKNAEIFSYVVSGALAHKDSMGNEEIISRGEVQFTSAGNGIFHSEYNAGDKVVHFIQIWVQPDTANLKPNYITKRFPDEIKKNRLCLIVSKSGEDNSIPIHQNIKMFASILEKGSKIKHKFTNLKYGYIHLIQTKTNSSLEINGTSLNEGDGAFIENVDELEITSTSANPAEFLFFELN